MPMAGGRTIVTVISILESNCGGKGSQSLTKGKCLGTREDVTHQVGDQTFHCLFWVMSYFPCGIELDLRPVFTKILCA